MLSTTFGTFFIFFLNNGCIIGTLNIYYFDDHFTVVMGMFVMSRLLE